MKHRDKRVLFGFVLGLSAGLIFGSYGFSYFNSQSKRVNPTGKITNQAKATRTELLIETTELLVPPHPEYDTSTLDLIERVVVIERQFVSSIKSCLGSKCIDEPPKGSKIDRVLVHGLPHSGGDILFRMLKKLCSMEPKSIVQLEFSSRALPYGYGRNFGFNRVIKLVARPLFNVVALLEGAQTLAASKEAAVLYLRWHCRSKIGHTKSLLLFSDDVMSRRSYVNLEEAASFVGLKPSRPNLLKVLQTEGLVDTPWPNIDHWSHGQLPWPEGTSVDLVLGMIEAMETELHESNSLQNWPCGSMRGLGDSPLSSILLPNCSALYTDCFVSHDSKEGEHV